MMGARQRRKGAHAERELFGLLTDELGFVVRRNLTQSRRPGGPDSIDIPGWSIEVKRQEKEALSQWWQQAVTQAATTGTRPILFYRASRQPWRALIAAKDVFPGGSEHPAILSFTDACTVLRESLDNTCYTNYTIEIA